MKRLLLTVISLCILYTGAALAYDTETSARANGWKQSDLNKARNQTLGNDHPETGNYDCSMCHTEEEYAELDDEYEGVISTDEIFQYTMETDPMSCMDWKPVGICVWMTCYLLACEFDWSIKFRNFVPDLVVQSYDRANGEPWTESQKINQFSQADSDSSWVMKLIGLIEDYDLSDIGTKGGISSQAHKSKHAGLNFKLVDIYGNPAALMYLAANKVGEYICKGATTPFFPYFISNLDSIQWRWDMPEFFYPMSWDVITHIWDLDDGYDNTYGGIYPRMGFSTGQDPLKAAVLTAFRAGHVVTRKGQPHVYYTAKGKDKKGYWVPDGLDKDEKGTGQFQMLYPDVEEDCTSFPLGKEPAAKKRSSDNSYVWNFWREYKCCEKKGAVLLFHSG